MIQVTPPAGTIRATVNLPLSKSIANRQLCIRYLSGSNADYRLPDCDDSLLMRDLLSQLGSDKSKKVYDCGDAGTVFRFMTAILANTEGDWLITGSERMQQRPCGPLVNALNDLGADVTFQSQPGFPPLIIKGSQLRGGDVSIDASVSSQFISALMMIGPTLPNGLNIVLKGNIVSEPYIELTAGLMQEQGIAVEFRDSEIRVTLGSYQFKKSLAEADWSAASYWFAAAAMASNTEFCLKGLSRNSKQGDNSLPVMFEELGVESKWEGADLILRNSGKLTKEYKADFTGCPDLFPAIAVTCAGLGVRSSFSGLSTLALKESDRLKSIGHELSKLGYRIRQENDLFEIFPGRVKSDDHKIETYADHRIAMAFAMLTHAAGQLTILNPSAVSKSYPDFWDHLQQAGFNLVLS
jgi:3-phosphoshikimate 1-carboxyvinyltransferase